MALRIDGLRHVPLHALLLAASFCLAMSAGVLASDWTADGTGGAMKIVAEMPHGPVAAPARSPSAEQVQAKRVQVSTQRGRSVGRALLAAPGRGDGLPVVRVQAASGDDYTCWVQRHLAELGFDPGTIDCQSGPRTREAVGDYQASIGHRRTGSLSEAQATHLGALVAHRREVDALRDAYAKRVRLAWVERALADLGYPTGAIDGEVDATSLAAIRSFQSDIGMMPSGRLSDTGLLELRVMSGFAGGMLVAGLPALDEAQRQIASLEGLDPIDAEVDTASPFDGPAIPDGGGWSLDDLPDLDGAFDSGALRPDAPHDTDASAGATG